VREARADTMIELGQRSDPLAPLGRRRGGGPLSPLRFSEMRNPVLGRTLERSANVARSGVRGERANDHVAAAAPAALDTINHGVGFDTTPIATALNWRR